jgi:hypothetical protein
MSPVVRPWRVLAKGVALFLIFEFGFVTLHPSLEWLNVYNSPALKRERFPVSTNAPEDAALDVYNLDAMFASHIVSEPKAANEYRVFILGDSSVWGVGLTPEQTLSGQMNALGLKYGSKNVRVYNLSFPLPSSTKDLMILDKAMAYQPDKIIWLITWFTLIPKSRWDHILIRRNPDEMSKLGQRFNFLSKNNQGSASSWITPVKNQNQTLFWVLRYQLYSLINLATRMDQIPGPPEVLPQQLSRDPTFQGMRPPTLNIASVSLDQVQDFYVLAGNVPVLLINEPIEVLTNVPNSNIRYDVDYPRWVYDQYRQYMSAATAQNHWNYLDLWNVFPSRDFTDTPLHLMPADETELARMIAPAVTQGCP